jgi:hypothetical protein
MSTIKTETLSTPSNATVPVDTVVNGTAKAWVNFNGTGTVAIRRAFNVSSITDNGTGDYSVNFTTAMVDANYAGHVSGNTTGSGDWNAMGRLSDMTSSNFRLRVGYTSGYYDNNAVCVSVFS